MPGHWLLAASLRHPLGLLAAFMRPPCGLSRRGVAPGELLVHHGAAPGNGLPAFVVTHHWHKALAYALFARTLAYCSINAKLDPNVLFPLVPRLFVPLIRE